MYLLRVRCARPHDAEHSVHGSQAVMMQSTTAATENAGEKKRKDKKSSERTRKGKGGREREKRERVRVRA